jgi:hypothetical protein
MEQLKKDMIIEINNYIKDTEDYDLDYFQSDLIVNYMEENNLELIWWPTSWYSDNLISDIKIEEI